MQQINWNRAKDIAEQAAKHATGFTRVDPKTTYTLTGADIQRVMENAGFKALQLAGCLDEHDAACRRRDALLAQDAERRHNAFRKATGLRC